MDHRDPFLRTVSFLTGIAEIPVVKRILVFTLISALLCSSAVGFARLFFDADLYSESSVPTDWMIRNDTADSHPLEAVKDEETSSIAFYQLSLSLQNSGVKAWGFVLRLILKELLAAGLGLCCILAARRTSLVCWISSTCSHTYIISYIISLSSSDRSSLRW